MGVLSLISVIVLIAAWRVLTKRAKTAANQAEVASVMTQLSPEQSQTAAVSAANAKEQSQFVTSQPEQNSAPLIVAQWEGSEGPWARYTLMSNGSGIALQLAGWYGGLELRSGSPERFPISPSTMEPGATTSINVDTAKSKEFTVMYTGADGTHRFTIVPASPDKPQDYAEQRGNQIHYLSKSPQP